MKKMLMWACVAMLAVSARGAGPEPKFPENKVFNGTKGYQEALELQKQFGADIYLYFTSSLTKDQSGLCSWYERKGETQPAVAKLLRTYLKVEVRLPLGKKDEAVFERFGVKKGPTVIILKPDGKFNYCKVFDWQNKEPKLLDADELVALFRSKSSAKYQDPAAPAAPAAKSP